MQSYQSIALSNSVAKVLLNMKVSILSLSALLGVAAGFSSVPRNSQRASSLTSSGVHMSSTAVDAAPFAKPPR